MVKNDKGTSPEKAILVQSVADEYRWVETYCPGFKVVTQSLIMDGDKPFDVLTVSSGEQDSERDIYFDISAFFGREKEPGPPCPDCGTLLRTPRAKQCRFCMAILRKSRLDAAQLPSFDDLRVLDKDGLTILEKSTKFPDAIRLSPKFTWSLKKWPSAQRDFQYLVVGRKRRISAGDKSK